ncbi:MAG: hypothetical protein V1811_00020, partial [Candidatus Micrarchaeota archaeon]
SYSASSQLQMHLSKTSGSINAGASDSILLVVSAPDNAKYATEYAVVFQAKGKTTASSTVTVKTLDEDYCRNLVLSITPQLPAHKVTSSVKNARVECEECGSQTFEIALENTGAFDEELSLSVTGAAWAFINPSSIVLAKGEKKSVFVYLAPPAGTQAGNYALNFTSRGTRGVFATSKLEVVVLAAGQKPGEATSSPVAVASSVPSETASPEASPDASRLSGLFTAGNTISALIIAILGGLVALWLLLGREKPAAAKKEAAGEEEPEAEKESVEEPEENEKDAKKKPKAKKK